MKNKWRRLVIAVFVIWLSVGGFAVYSYNEAGKRSFSYEDYLVVKENRYKSLGWSRWTKEEVDAFSYENYKFEIENNIKRQQKSIIIDYIIISSMLSAISASLVLGWPLIKKIPSFCRTKSFRRAALLVASYWLILVTYLFVFKGYDFDYWWIDDHFCKVSLIPPAVAMAIYVGFKKFWR